MGPPFSFGRSRADRAVAQPSRAEAGELTRLFVEFHRKEETNLRSIAILQDSGARFCDRPISAKIPISGAPRDTFCRKPRRDSRVRKKIHKVRSLSRTERSTGPPWRAQTDFVRAGMAAFAIVDKRSNAANTFDAHPPVRAAVAVRASRRASGAPPSRRCTPSSPETERESPVAKAAFPERAPRDRVGAGRNTPARQLPSCTASPRDLPCIES